ncbi:hypothetical protein [Pantoea vagans]|uniref:hypothetical protein n=1 Tax=Pantoea vagans TaxID=470934 RepID=UPI00241E3694|nr:hypothetical protein [Pantoea vagans]
MKLFVNVMLLIISFICPIGVATSSQVSLTHYNSLDNVSKVFSNQGVVSRLKSVLGNDYDNFSQNFDVFGEPHKTDDGGIFVEGWLISCASVCICHTGRWQNLCCLDNARQKQNSLCH